MGKITKEVSLWAPDWRTTGLVSLTENYHLQSVAGEMSSRRGGLQCSLGLEGRRASLVMTFLAVSGWAAEILSPTRAAPLFKLGQLRRGVEAAHIQLSSRVGRSYFTKSGRSIPYHSVVCRALE